MPHPLLLDIAVWMTLPAPGPAPADVFTPTYVERALGGDRSAQRHLFHALLPHVQKKVNAVLVRRASAGGRRPVRQEVLDLTQDVFVALFEHDGRALRAWHPDKGASLPTWVGRVAEKRIISTLRTAKRNPWTETPTEAEAFERVVPALPSAHAKVASRQQLERVLDALRADLSEQAFALFVALFVEQQEVDAICAAHGMTANAVYIWRTRLKKAAKAALEAVSDAGVKDSSADARKAG
ncbi:MAG: sigma-70 family RNA polymerase sigma factor [Myxococcales bacterium]|nr:sigma-70 family RNA polymerase sigma factor [Myxococcales bacterium]MCB9522451.1 sigma-70 family RNA polymerase sigma factor [Myxococcales bacterium]